MARFLFASIAVPAHTTNALPFAARLVEPGHDVDWYAGRAFHGRIAAVGARPVAYDEAVDFSEAICTTTSRTSGTPRVHGSSAGPSPRSSSARPWPGRTTSLATWPSVPPTRCCATS